MAEIIEFNQALPGSQKPKDLVGRLLMLNIPLADPRTKRFQCGGFIVTSRNLIAVVTEQAQQQAIHAALESGLLIDITDNDVAKKGFSYKNNSTSRINTEDTSKKAFVTRDEQGRIAVLIPKDDEERTHFEQLIAEKGYLDVKPEESENFTGFNGGIFEEDI